ncbi:MAG: hypothetical protein QME66_09565 [Candidatus Eisenbacteria bacterium]|nr:hypothetical protein [Candidatus Eisenbacteria bacterium]
MSRYEEADLSLLKTIPIEKRKSKVRVEDFLKIPGSRGAAPAPAGTQLSPEAEDSLRQLVKAICTAKAAGRTIGFMMGGHVVKTGVSPAVIELMKAGFVTVAGMPGSTAIHDFEIAMWGRTSEPVEDVLDSGEFGMACEPARLMNHAIRKGRENAEGLGEALGRFLTENHARYSERSILASAYSLGIPATVHVTIGADVIHMHPECDGASLGELSHRDFKIFVAALKKLGGGVLVNIGSAVVMPEVFLKAVSILRNQGIDLTEMVTANLDRIAHYRPTKNVVERPVSKSGKGLFIQGEHEVLVPLLCSRVLEYFSEKRHAG